MYTLQENLQLSVLNTFVGRYPQCIKGLVIKYEPLLWAGCITRRSNKQNRNLSSSNTNLKKENKHDAGEHSEYSITAVRILSSVFN
jgi:hypothetical protein